MFGDEYFEVADGLLHQDQGAAVAGASATTAPQFDSPQGLSVPLLAFASCIEYAISACMQVCLLCCMSLELLRLRRPQPDPRVHDDPAVIDRWAHGGCCAQCGVQARSNL